jgi:hypothetical protein
MSEGQSRGILDSARFKLINWYPPLLGAGIRVRHRDGDAYTIKVKMPLTRLNLDAVGTHFGGSLYAMCDPWFMLILMQHLGRDYIVWDKAAVIQFVKPGKGTVYATFHIPPETSKAFARRPMRARSSSRCSTSMWWTARAK